MFHGRMSVNGTWARCGIRLRRVLTLILAIGSPWLVEAAEGKKLKVLTSFMPIYCFAANVAGDAAEVQNLLPGNVGPHDYQPTRSDYEKVSGADLLILNGLKLEDWVQRVLKSRSSKKSMTVVEVSKGLEAAWIRDVPELRLEGGGAAVRGHDAHHDHDHDHGDANPHLWLDPVLAIHSVSNVLIALQRADPGNASVYATNAARYVEKLQRLDRDFQVGLSMKAQQSPFIAYHDAFVYLAKRYHLNLVGVIEEVPEVTPSLRYQAALRRAIVQNQVKVIFAEPQFPQKIAAQLSADTHIPMALLDTLETPASGRLEAQSYEDGMRSNLATLIQHLR